MKSIENVPKFHLSPEIHSRGFERCVGGFMMKQNNELNEKWLIKLSAYVG